MKFYCKQYSILIVLSIGLGKGAQAQNVQRISLAKAWELALQNNPDVKSGAIDLSIAEAANEKLRAQRLPQISAQADFRVNTQLQSTVLPFDVTGQDPLGTSTVKFGTRFANTLGLQIDQKVYDPTRRINEAINNQLLEDRQLLQKADTFGIRFEVTKAYFVALYYREKMALDSQNLNRAALNLKTGETQWQSGNLLDLDKQRLEVALRNAQIGVQQSSQQYALSLMQLKEELHLDAEVQLELTTALDELVNKDDDLILFHAASRPEVQRSILGEQLEGTRSEEILARNKPMINAYGHYGLLQLNENFNPFEIKNWYPYNYLGLQISIPIFDGKQTKLHARDHQLERQKWHTNTLALSYQFEQQFLQNRLALDQAENGLQSAKENINLAKAIYEVDQYRFQQGVLLATQLRQSEYDLQTAQDQYLDALYQVLLAEINIRQLYGFQ